MRFSGKTVVILLTKNAAVEYRKDQIRVNAIAPDGIDTKIIDGWRRNERK